MPKKNQKKIELDKEERKLYISEIKNYFKKVRDEEIGDLAAILFLDFIIEKIGPGLYNKGISISLNYMRDRVDDLYSLEL